LSLIFCLAGLFVAEDLRHRRQLAMREATATAKENGKVAESGKFGSDPLAGWQATVPGNNLGVFVQISCVVRFSLINPHFSIQCC
jgi:hypothetical protein